MGPISVTHLSEGHVPVELVGQQVVHLIQGHGVQVAHQVVVLLLLVQLEVELLEPGCKVGAERALAGGKGMFKNRI